MKYSYEYKNRCVDLYREGKWAETPEGVKEKWFRKTVRGWVRTVEACGLEALRHKNKNRIWTAEEKYELVAKVLVGESCTKTAIEAGINKGLLYQYENTASCSFHAGKTSCTERRTAGEPPPVRTQLHQGLS